MDSCKNLQDEESFFFAAKIGQIIGVWPKCDNSFIAKGFPDARVRHRGDMGREFFAPFIRGAKHGRRRRILPRHWQGFSFAQRNPVAPDGAACFRPRAPAFLLLVGLHRHRPVENFVMHSLR